MNASLLSLQLCGRRLSSLALLGAAALAACDNDRPLGPSPASVPTAPSAAKAIKGGSLYVTIVDQNGAAPTTTGAQFTVGAAGGKTYFLVDNGPGDTDPTPNKLQMKLSNGSYNVCQTVAPSDYVLPSPACQSVMVGGIVVAQLTFVDPTVPHVAWVIEDPMIVDTIGGAVFKDGTGQIFFADNGAIDLDPTPGRIEVKTTLSTFWVCPVTPPAGYAFKVGSQSCRSTATAPGQTTELSPFLVSPEASAYWFVSIGNDIGVGSEYTITAAEGGWMDKVVDDGLNDLALGAIVYVKLPAPGWYTICQTVAPKGGQLADPACKRVEVQFGDPYYAGYFDSKPL